MPRPTVNLIGKRFGRLLVVEKASSEGKKKTRWHCICDCGERSTVYAQCLKRGSTRSCGCLHKQLASEMLKGEGGLIRERSLKSKITHGHTKTKAYRSWHHAKGRCHNPSDRAYRNYGARGIEMCDRWRDSFENFLADMGEPTEDVSLDRIDNDGPYSPENCRWATRVQQARNKRSNRRLEYSGICLTATEWSERVGISANCILKRLDIGWTLERALTQPVGVTR